MAAYRLPKKEKIADKADNVFRGAFGGVEGGWTF
jgi:hypothetical protein